MTPEWTNCVIGVIALVIAIIGLAVVYFQLKSMTASLKVSAESNRIQNLLAVLTLEDSIARSRQEFARSALELEAAAERQQKGATFSPEYERCERGYKERKEQYLNTVDRLCACIMRKLVSEEIYRKDYRKTLDELVTGYPESFGADTRHRNIKAVNEAWAQDKSACT